MALTTNVRVATEYGPGVILDMTGRSVTILLDLVEHGSQAKINIQRGTYGWDRFVAANPILTGGAAPA